MRFLSLLRLRFGFAAQAPFNAGFLAFHGVQDDDLLGPADLAGTAEINALLQRHRTTGGTQAPTGAARQLQQNRGCVLQKGRLYLWMQMEADRKGLATPLPHEPVLSTQLLPRGGKISRR